MDVLLLRSQREFFSAVSSGDLDSVKRLLHHLTQNNPNNNGKEKKDRVCGEEEDEDGSSSSSSSSSSSAAAAKKSPSPSPSPSPIDVTIRNDEEEEMIGCNPQVLQLIRGEGCLDSPRKNKKEGERTTPTPTTTALHIAAEKKREQILRHLLRFCDMDTASLKSKDHGNRTAFHIAARDGQLGMVKEFLDRWPSLCGLCDDTNSSPIYDAAVRDHLDVVNAILDVDASTIRIVRKKNGKTALHVAARRGYLRIVKAVLDRDPHLVPIVDKKGQTALHMAVKALDNTQVVEHLILHSDDLSILNTRDKKGNTPLHVATRKWRQEVVRHLLRYGAIDVDAINNLGETAMDLAEKVPYDKSGPEMMASLREAGARNARNIGKLDEASELRRTVSDIKHDVHTQLLQNEKTNKRVTGIAKEVRKLHRKAVKNTINSVTVVAVLIASIAFVAIFNLPGQYVEDVGEEVGKANIADTVGFRAFCLLNATALFISLAVVVVQITLVAWETGAQKLVVSIINKLMWAACMSTCGAFLSVAFVDVGYDGESWMAITVTLIGGPVMVGTLGIMAYMVFRQYFKFYDDSQRRIRRGVGGSKSFSMSLRSAALSDQDPDLLSDRENKTIYAL